MARPESGAAAQGYSALLVQYPAELADRIHAILWEAGTVGLEEFGTESVRAFFVGRPRRGLARRLTTVGAIAVSAEAVEEHDWVMRSRRHQRARRVGRLLVRPPWSRARPQSGEELLVIDPARAFGTGSHESTRLVIGELLELGPRRRLLDLGTGSGILALAGLRFGVERAVGVDIDPEAVEAARRNAQLNGLSDRLDLVLGAPNAIAGDHELVLANLSVQILSELRDDISRLVAVGGHLLTSGFLEADIEAIRSRFEGAGLELRSRRIDGEWASLSFHRPTRKGPA